MKLPTGILGWWNSIARSTWRAFIVFGGLAAAGVAYMAYAGRYAGWSVAEIARDAGVAFALMFVASFVTSVIYYLQAQRTHRWPGGGGRRGRS